MRMFGAVARGLRENAGVTTDALAERVGYSKSLIIKVERGERMPPPMFVEKATELLGGGALLAQAAAHLERRSDFPEWFEPYADLERSAISLYKYDNFVVNGLLQTVDYARALLSDSSALVEADEIERRVEARLARQNLLTRTPLAQLAFLVEESALKRPLGGPDVHKAQLTRLLGIGQLRNVTIQVVATSAEAHAGFDGPMTLIETEARRQFGYLEVQGRSFLLEDRDEVSTLNQRYAMIRSQALSVRESAKVIEQIAGEL
ncbi:Scr1 family TA system antitoxin-like transcriptional regulator [Streptomyces sp. PLK6-54]|uniref:Scr1 family TA system antitoxin-like transcriptional regulator n=2 Tax=Actinacidiphila acidipaludis TaxID=2873382 RepID=A0ABS7QA69_9ACTN|nr:Scr1 family TA system antitoxin-like transcriptional regulator [Streptomyces acidipaludis]